MKKWVLQRVLFCWLSCLNRKKLFNRALLIKKINKIEFSTFIKLRIDDNISDLFKITGVTEVSEVTGRFDILVTMNSHSLDEMHKLISERVGRIEGVQKTETFIEMRKTTREIPIPPKE